MKNGFFGTLKQDLPAGIVVFLVAVPLCLGIALASGAPLFSGLIAGIVGGIIVGYLSGSPLGVSGPAAGLAVIVLNAIDDLGSFEVFLMAVVLAGVIQVVLGIVKGGIIAYYFPSSVIMGMLSGIGIIIFLKQIPHAVGYDKDPEGDFAFQQMDNENTFSELWNMLDYISYGPLLIAAVALGILILWEQPFMKKIKALKVVPGPLVAVITGALMTVSFASIPELALIPEQLVTVPVAKDIGDFFGNFTLPSLAALGNSQVYLTAVIIAVVASLETLLCVEATDKLDPHKRVTPTNRELRAQGIGNIISGMIGGLPVTQVIVRSSANIQSGAETKVSAISHGFLLLLSVAFIPMLLNLIPLAALAAILLVVGYKLAKPSLFRKMYSQGRGQFIPYLVTVLGIVFTDLLIGLGIGLAVAIFFILYHNYRIPYKIKRERPEGMDTFKLELAQEMTFLNKASILKTLSKIPSNSKVEIDATNTYYMHLDILQIIEDFKIQARDRNIELVVTGLYEHKDPDPPIHISLSTNGDGNKAIKRVIG